MAYADLASAGPLTCPVGPREAWSLGPATFSSSWKGSCSKFLPLGPDKLNMGYKCSKRNLPTAWTYKRLGKSPLKLDPERAAIKELIHKSRVRLEARLGAGGWGLGWPWPPCAGENQTGLLCPNQELAMFSGGWSQTINFFLSFFFFVFFFFFLP